MTGQVVTPPTDEDWAIDRDDAHRRHTVLALRKLADEIVSGKQYVSTGTVEQMLEEVPTAPDEHDAWRATGVSVMTLAYANSPELAEAYRREEEQTEAAAS